MRCGGASVSSLQPFEREREVRAALGGGQRVDLVDDHPSDAAQRLARLRREHQVERLRRGDEDVGRVRQHLAPLVRPGCRRCARPPSARAASGDAERARRRARCRRAGRGGSSRRRPRARAAARCRGRGCAPWVGAAARSPSRSIAHRNAASVLPEPVGARISVWSPSAMAAQPSRLRGRGLVERGRRTTSRTAGEKGASAHPHTVPATTDSRGCRPGSGPR